MPQRQEREFSLAELADESGVTERTIRFYISRGVVPAPARAGRDAAYTKEHLARLRLIRQKQRDGLTLAQIERELAGGDTANLPQPDAWWVYSVAPDVTVQIRGNAMSPWRARQLKSALEKFAAEVMGENDGGGKEDQ